MTGGSTEQLSKGIHGERVQKGLLMPLNPLICVENQQSEQLLRITGIKMLVFSCKLFNAGGVGSSALWNKHSSNCPISPGDLSKLKCCNKNTRAIPDPGSCTGLLSNNPQFPTSVNPHEENTVPALQSGLQKRLRTKV